ncbi:WD40 repeat domain-containing protein [Micromonospora citrea]|uniref:WD40 repeat domain-containing protein n=1 Tax=Micromonospora citrea TaxID=47855 RepID=UPI00114CA15A|nr:hypothetical protein [Micromonospora citrea]
MTEYRIVHRLSGHDGYVKSAALTETDGASQLVGVNGSGEVWMWDLRRGDCSQLSLSLDAAAPDEEWFREHGLLDEHDDEVDDEYDEYDDEDGDAVGDASEIVDSLVVAEIDAQRVLVTGGSRFDLAFYDEDQMGGALRVWDLRTGRKLGRTMTGHGLGVTSMAVVASERGPLSVSSSEEGTLLAWDLTSGQLVSRLEGSYNGAMGAANIGGRPIAVTGGHDDHLEAWDILAGQKIATLPGVEEGAGVVALTELGGRGVVVAGCGDRTLRMWDVATQDQIGPPRTGHPEQVDRIAVVRIGGRTVAVTGSSDGTRLWDLSQGDQIGNTLVDHQFLLAAELAGSPVVVTDGPDQTVHVWDVTSAGR